MTEAEPRNLKELGERWKTEMEIDKKVDWFILFIATFWTATFPIFWATQIVGLLAIEIGKRIITLLISLRSRFPYPRVFPFPHLPEVYCPMAHPEKYGENDKKEE